VHTESRGRKGIDFCVDKQRDSPDKQLTHNVIHLRFPVSRGRIAESVRRVLSYFDEFDGADSGGPSMISRTDRGINGGLAQMIINLV